MNNTQLPQASVLSFSEFTPVQTRYFLASINLLFVLAAGGLMYFYAVSGSGAAVEGSSEDLLVVLIRIFCTLGGAIAGGAWLFSWVQLRQSNSE